MKLKCSKCNTLLTQDLYYQKVSFDKQPILLWHDEYLVAESLEDKLTESISSAWKKVLGSNMNCKIKKEF